MNFKMRDRCFGLLASGKGHLLGHGKVRLRVSIDYLQELPPELPQQCKADASPEGVGAPCQDRSSLCVFAAIHSIGTSSEHA